MTKQNIDLTLLKRLLAELDASVQILSSISTDVPSNKTEIMVEGAKAAGLAAGLMQESAAIMGDVYTFLDGGAAASPIKNDFLDKIMGSFKGPGSTN